ncbi:O-methyltransferase [Ferruginivarius sediminum]|uniref:O-methyltransferase n=1 Tax=Ferruginivarius sediminum TaxID=2661937 RepID=UPI0011C0342F|nr:O-methyltransferase [Ferruginivarius sediminum]
MSSTADINYAIRPNKCIERKLFFEFLAECKDIFEFQEYRYIGFGSTWFVDFVMAHKYLRISDMLSIEKSKKICDRAKFNKPYGCVKIILGNSSDVLPTVRVEEKPVIAWLDYEDSINGPVFSDVEELCRRMKSGSMLVVTLNAHKGSIPHKDRDGNEFQSEEDKLRFYAGDLVPPKLRTKDLQMKRFPQVLASMILQHVRTCARYAGRTDVTIPILNVKYRDNAPMMSVAVAFVSRDVACKVDKRSRDIGFCDWRDAEKQAEIAAPSLTFREKSALDQLLPCNTAPTGEQVKALGFSLPDAEIQEYHRFYRHYPVYGEVGI